MGGPPTDARPFASLRPSSRRGAGVRLNGPTSNECTAVQPLLAPLELRGTLVTADALHTRKELATFLVEDKGADYLFTVKDNQPTLKADIAALQLETFPPSAPDR